ncbi:hypothetical protein B7486_51045 [cyanobacterium TDX16]|nr:hypothetical protein B7486_51045 [cyanobacterium TDX16]
MVGGDVLFEGGVVTTPNGRIEISSVDSGKINLIYIPFGWSFGNEGTNSFKDIKLTKQSLLDASGASFGDIHIQGRNINFTDGSLALIANSNSLNPGAIRLDAAETIDLTGITFYNNQPFLRRQRLNRGIITSAEFGKGADIIISTKNVIARDSTLVASLAFGNSLGGNLIIKSAESVKILGVAANESSGVGSSFSTIDYGSNQAGNIGLSTKQLWIEDGGTLESLTFGSGAGGNVNVNASEVIKVLGGYAVDVLLAFGTKPISSFSPSRILAQSISSGNAGNINIQTKHLMIENGGRIAASGLKTGNSGNIFVNASDSINISSSGSVNPFLNPSTISSSVNTVDPFLRYLYNIQQPPEAFSGDIIIKTGSLNLKDGAQVTVRNDSKKDAGIVRVEADFVNLDRQSDIIAATASGKGGDIFLRSQTLQLRNGSSINTDATGGTGNGGNIAIDTILLTILEKSNITANAVRGQGGNIRIDTQALFRSPDSSIAASSQLGINGRVQINGINISPSRALVEPEAVRATPEITSACQGRSSASVSQFVITGTGGIPSSPNDALSSHVGWYDNSLPAGTRENSRELELSTQDEPTHLVEAQGWRQNRDGSIVLTAEPSGVVPYSSLATPTCDRPSTPGMTSFEQE